MCSWVVEFWRDAQLSVQMGRGASGPGTESVGRWLCPRTKGGLRNGMSGAVFRSRSEELARGMVSGAVTVGRPGSGAAEGGYPPSSLLPSTAWSGVACSSALRSCIREVMPSFGKSRYRCEPTVR